MNRIETRRDFFKVATATTIVVAGKLVDFSFAGASQGDPGQVLGVTEKEIKDQDKIAAGLGVYYQSAQRNIVATEDGKVGCMASPMYGRMIYCRDAFYTAVGLESSDLSQNFYQWFEKNQDRNTGQVATNVSLEVEEKAQFNRDEASLLYIIWSGMLAKEGVSVNRDSVMAAYEYVKRQTREGSYVTRPEASGNYCYWADNLILPKGKEDVISYNHGLYVCVLETLSRMGIGEVSAKLLEEAKKIYIGQYNPRGGYLALSKNLPFQDASALFPETLHRFLFGEGILPDDLVVGTVARRLNTSVVNYSEGTPAGIKIISQEDGSFLPKEYFYTKELSSPGDYQNGGYWPMWSLTELALAYKITKDQYLSSLVGHLLSEETKNGVSMEFICLSPDAVGLADANRGSYSWNSCFVPIAKWSGLYRPRRYRFQQY